MTIINTYQCEICKANFETPEGAQRCEAQGLFDPGVFPIGFIFRLKDWFAVVIQSSIVCGQPHYGSVTILGFDDSGCIGVPFDSEMLYFFSSQPHKVKRWLGYNVDRENPEDKTKYISISDLQRPAFKNAYKFVFENLRGVSPCYFGRFGFAYQIRQYDDTPKDGYRLEDFEQNPNCKIVRVYEKDI